ncbi:MAG TPA: kelch repeat-containing protein [Candidatus Dormibacteraeota bacterium]
MAKCGRVAPLLVVAFLVIGVPGTWSVAVPQGQVIRAVTGGWAPVGSMLTGRAEHTATRLLDGRVLVAGGTNGQNHGLASTELFDPKTIRWSDGPPMSTTRVDHTATLLEDGRVLVAGGFDQLDQAERSLASAEIFDPKSNSWMPAASMLEARGRHTATLLASGTVLVVGGFTAAPLGRTGGFANVAEVYDPATNRWSPTGPLGTGGRQGHTATRLLDGRVLVAGGEGGLGGNPSVEIYHPSTNGWTFGSFLLAPHVGHTATLLPSGEVLLVGGAGSISLTLREPQALATAELYEPSSDRWILLAPMHSTRDHHTATLLPSGRLLVVGGAFTSTPLAELFDLARNAWVEVNGQALNRYAHTATLLADGRVLITGGYNAPSMASTWIYDPAGRALSVGGTSPSPVALAALLAGVALVLALAFFGPRMRVRLPRWPSPSAADEWIDP